MFGLILLQVEIFEPNLKDFDLNKLRCRLKDIYFPYIQVWTCQWIQSTQPIQLYLVLVNFCMIVASYVHSSFNIVNIKINIKRYCSLSKYCFHGLEHTRFYLFRSCRMTTCLPKGRLLHQLSSRFFLYHYTVTSSLILLRINLVAYTCVQLV
jgi:hypothetical protein